MIYETLPSKCLNQNIALAEMIYETLSTKCLKQNIVPAEMIYIINVRLGCLGGNSLSEGSDRSLDWEWKPATMSILADVIPLP